MKTTAWLVFILLISLSLRAADGDNQKPFDLTTLVGETFQNCRIIKNTPEGITVLHDRGVTRISFENLNDDWKKLFNYSPEKAKAFKKAEAERLALAAEKQRQTQIENEKRHTKQRSTVTTAKSQRLQKLEEVIAQRQVETAVAAVLTAISQLGLTIPLPLDPAQYFDTGLMASLTLTAGSSGTTVPSTTEALVPATTPITQIFTPDTTGGQRYIINQGSVFTPGDGSIYYVNPGYPYPGYVTPVYTNPPIIICPPIHVRPGFPTRPTPVTRSSSSTIRIGP